MSRPILTVGPRILPDASAVRVWIDTGSGAGHMREVATSRLALAPTDDGEGSSAVYLLHPPGAHQGPDLPAGTGPARAEGAT